MTAAEKHVVELNTGDAAQQNAAQVSALVDKLGAAFNQCDATAVAELFIADGLWRDILAFTWHLGGANGRENIAKKLGSVIANIKPTGLKLFGQKPIRACSRGGRDVLEVLMSFETSVGPCNAVARLLMTDEGLKIWSLSTTLDEIRGHEDIAKQASKTYYSRQKFGGDNWLDKRQKAVKYDDHDPEVLVVGAGQCGLAVAARLNQLGIDTLVAESHGRVGDCWRKRYHALTLHNQTHIAHFPYTKFPETYPMWMPKDLLANWMEYYVDALEINVWTSTRFESGDFDEQTGRWDATVTRDGVEKKLRPKHIIMATGISGKPRMPDFPGLKDFAGEVMHSSAFQRGSDYAGKNVVILGAGNSSHDVAQDLHGGGVGSVTMFQRGSLTVCSVESGNTPYAIYNEGLPLEEADLALTATPYPQLVEGFQAAVEQIKVNDADLISGLEKAGMKLDWGEDNTGPQMKYFRRGGGYYLNVGCSDLIISGEVQLKQFEEFDQVVPEGVRLVDGTVIPADLIVVGTGYESLQDLVRSTFNDEIAENVGPIFGWGDDGELRNMYKRTKQKNLWFHGGSLTQSRVMSKFLALQIKAIELGLIDAEAPDTE